MGIASEEIRAVYTVRPNRRGSGTMHDRVDGALLRVHRSWIHHSGALGASA